MTGSAQAPRRRGGAPPRELHARARVDRVVSNMPGCASLPRRNGELVFDEPWESRVFGMAVALHNVRGFRWEGFQQLLVEEIAAWEREHGEELSLWNYYERWTRALERLLISEGLFTENELAEATASAELEEGHRHD